VQSGIKSGKMILVMSAGSLAKKKFPAKVMWYFPIIPCLKRLFRKKAHTKLMRWHKEERKHDQMPRHPADGSQWRNVDREFLDFNLPSWLCMKRKYIMMPVLIQGPKQPGSNIACT
jgi:hypothetical protein